jgi:hypothetical protein
MLFWHRHPIEKKVQIAAIKTNYLGSSFFTDFSNIGGKYQA